MPHVIPWQFDTPTERPWWAESGPDHDPFECTLRMFVQCGFCGARCSHDHTDACWDYRKETDR